ncbi:MAG: formylglycine-generating enzyme family protein [Campylobacterales bacterium]|nr:formylglycine-generating enzyme family protein [Campylobacterales bacterium]
MMGSDEYSNEKPIHKVTIDYEFEISKYPVTFDEYDLYCEDVKKKLADDNKWGRGRRPIMRVSWEDAVAYCEWLSQKSGQIYRLPTETEWEYACRAGTTTKWSFGDDEKELEKYAWYSENSEGKTHPVGELKPNPWGLHDMHGNVWEWCEDWYDKDKDTKVLRGGSWIDVATRTCSSVRDRSYPIGHGGRVGFRLLRALPF